MSVTFGRVGVVAPTDLLDKPFTASDICNMLADSNCSVAFFAPFLGDTDGAQSAREVLTMNIQSTRQPTLQFN